MDIIIQSLGFKASDNLEELVREKLNRIVKESDKVVRAHVTLYAASESNPNNNVCEIRLEVPGNDHFVKKGSDLFEKAIIDCTDALQNMIRKARDKQISNRYAEPELPE